jgi:hypothetical protein
MSIKFYTKKGKRNYKEVKLIRDLQPIIDKKIQDNPDLAENFRPATTFEELQALHRQYVSEEVEYEEIDNTDNKVDNTNNQNDMSEKIESKTDDFFEQIDADSDNVDFIDPFNREEPIVRDYVTGGGLKDETIPEGPTRTHFDEPLTFQDAFELPSDDDSTEEPKGKNASYSEPKKEKQKQQRQEPFNPSYDDMSSAKKKKSTKKFAKYIIEAVCALAEKGFVWYANKDINEAKLNEYELNGEMDLSILVTLDNGQQATVKQFFINQCYMAEELSRFETEEKQDMADALAEVFMEKGIAPTATQEALIVIGGVLVKKGAILFSLKAQTGSLLNQLRSMGGSSSQQYGVPYQEPQQQPQTQAESAPINEPSEEINTFDFSSIDEIENISDLEIEQVVETKE